MTFLGELLLIIDYCPYGNLHDYLLTHRYKFINQIDSSTGRINFTIEEEEKTIDFNSTDCNYYYKK